MAQACMKLCCGGADTDADGNCACQCHWSAVEQWAGVQWQPMLPFPPAPIVCTCNFSRFQWQCRCGAFAAEQAAKKGKP